MLAVALVNLDPGQTHQTLSGWEAESQVGFVSPALEAYRQELLTDAASDLGVNRVRLEVRSGVENTRDVYAEYLAGTIDYATWRSLRFSTVNDNASPTVANPSGFHFTEMDQRVDLVVLPLRQRLAERNEELYVNVTYTAFTNQIGPGLEYIHASQPDEYAEFVLQTFVHLRDKYGIVADSWEMILEPDNVPQWTPEAVGQALVAAGNRLAAAGFHPRFVVGSTANAALALTYFDQIVATPGAAPFVGELAYHRYAGVSTGVLQAIASRGAQYQIPTSMLEHIGSGYQDLHDDLKIANVSAWQQYALAFPTTDNGAQYYVVSDADPQHPTYALGNRTRYLRQYFHYLRAGAVRFDAQSSQPETVNPVAFRNVDGDQVVIVKAGAAAAWEISGLEPGEYDISYTTASETARQLPRVTLAAGERLAAAIPAAGVLTVAKVVDRTPPRVTQVWAGDSRLGGGADYALPAGGGQQLATVPVARIDRIGIAFSKDVSLDAGSLSVVGDRLGAYPVSGFAYDAAARRATWTLARPIDFDVVRIALASNGPSIIRDTAGRMLDGEWDDPTSRTDPFGRTFPSGDGRSGGAFHFRLLALNGDLNQDGRVTSADLTILHDHFGETAAAYAQGDLNADGRVDAADLTLWTDAAGRLVSYQALIGDANDDGRVTGSDFTIAFDYFGRQGVGRHQGDFNRDGVVTAADFTLWTDYFGQVAPPSWFDPQANGSASAGRATGQAALLTTLLAGPRDPGERAADRPIFDTAIREIVAERILPETRDADPPPEFVPTGAAMLASQPSKATAKRRGVPERQERVAWLADLRPFGKGAPQREPTGP